MLQLATLKEDLVQQLSDDIVKLSLEDQTRMRRLLEEIAARYAEMGLIVGRVLGKPTLHQTIFTPGGRTIFTAKQKPEGDDLSYCIEFPGGGVWEEPPGICREGSC